MKKRRKTGRQHTGHRAYNQRMGWYWTSNRLLIHQRAWLGMLEHDSRTPSNHYNLHIQPLVGGSDYHNYHIRYLGDQHAVYIWSIIDAPYGVQLSSRKYIFSRALPPRDAVDITSVIAAADITNDVDDTTLWLPLVEYLPHVLLDLYHTMNTNPRVQRHRQ